MTLHQATPADLSTVLALVEAYYAEFHIQQRDDPTYTARLLDAHSPGAGYFLALVDDVPAGCVMLRPLPLPNLHGTAVECKRLYVLPAFRGQRLGGPLMDFAEAAARNAGHTWVYLDTNEDFAAALAMYRRRGYEDIARFNDNPQATLFLRKRLIPAA